jgi:hypothetical protein
MRLARLQDLLGGLRTNGVNVVAGTYTHSWLRNREGDEIAFYEVWVRGPGNSRIKKIFETELVLSILFVPSDVEEEVIPIKPGPSLEDLEIVEPDEIPF